MSPGATSLTSSSNPATFGQMVTLSATVAPSTATGLVTFYDGTSVLGSGAPVNGLATLITGLLPSGTRSLKAHYTGDATYIGSTSAVLAQTIRTLPASGLLPFVKYSANTFLLNAALAVGDFNGDGRPDLASLEPAGVAISLGNGNGTFQPAVHYNTAAIIPPRL